MLKIRPLPPHSLQKGLDIDSIDWRGGGKAYIFKKKKKLLLIAFFDDYFEYLSLTKSPNLFSKFGEFTVRINQRFLFFLIKLKAKTAFTKIQFSIKEKLLLLTWDPSLCLDQL